MARRVLIAGLFHETHTFLEGRTRMQDFEVRQGSALLACAGDGSPLAGAVEAAGRFGWSVLPAADLRAAPGPVVADAAVEFFWNELAGAVRAAGGELDGVLLILHGAMVSESLDDVEGELLRRIRASIPPGAPVCGVLDLHANATAEMVRHSDALVAYRENPHTDARETAVRAAGILHRLMHTGERPRSVLRRVPVLWPPTGTGTAAEPVARLESLAREVETAHPEILAVNVLPGFAFADTPATGVSFSAVTVGDPEIARAHLDRLAALAWDSREAGNVLDPPIAAVMPKLRAHREGPVLLVEPSDNIGAGAPGSGTGVLRALIEHSIGNAVVVINAPEAVRQVRTLEAGGRAAIRLGGPFDPAPLDLEIELVSTSDGRFVLEDPQSHLASMSGRNIDMGPCAVVRHRGIRILLTSRRTPPFDLGQLRSQGIVPEEAFVIGVKAAVAHRRAYDPIARASYTVDTPGPCSSDLRSLPYRKLRRPVYPLDEEAGLSFLRDRQQDM